MNGQTNIFRRFCVLLLVFSLTSSSLACPFCSAVSQTFSEELDTMDVAVICRLTKLGKYDPVNNTNPQAEIPLSEFTITRVIKGGEFVKVDDTFECVYFGEAKMDRPFLAMATDAPKLQWSTPLILSDRAEKYLGALDEMNAGQALRLKQVQAQLKGEPNASLPADASDEERLKFEKQKQAVEDERRALGIERLVFFQDYLEDEDEMLARDAYDEFAKAPYDQVQGLKSKMDHAQLIAFLNDPDVPSNRRRLYFTMLGVCGTDADAKMLEAFMASDDRKKKAGLDSLIACYLMLTGESGLERVENQFLKETNSEYADTYAAIMAIRFHGNEVDVIPRARLTKALRYMLDRPELADLVIPDLAGWEDWEVIPKLVDLFAKADENSSWVRVPVVNYLRACPLPEAKEQIELLKTIDAEAVKRAMNFFAPPTKKKDTTQAQPKPPAKVKVSQSTKIPPGQELAIPPRVGEADVHKSTSMNSKGELAQLNASAKKGELKTSPISPQLSSAKDMKSAVSIAPPETLNQVESEIEKGTNPWLLLGVTSVCAVGCFIAMRWAIGMA